MIYSYKCPEGHVIDRVRRIAQRDDPTTCEHGHPATRIEIVASHVPPDGLYSYAPNIGDPDRFERQRHAMRDGVKVIPRTGAMPRDHRDGQITGNHRSRGY